MAAVEHSEVNISSAGFSGPSSLNKDIDAINITKYTPRSANISAPATPAPVGTTNINGNVEFQFDTSSNQWIDLFNTYIFTKYVIGTTGRAIEHITQNLISQAVLYLNGIQVSMTQNFTLAAQINRRMQFSKQYNENINGINYKSDATVAQQSGSTMLSAAATAGAAGPPVVPVLSPSIEPDRCYQIQPNGTYTDRCYLDGLFIKDRNSCWLPPNTTVRIVLTIDPLGTLKATKQPAAAVAAATTCTIQSIELVVPSIIRNQLPPSEYVLSLITNSITSSSAGSDCNRSLTINPAICKLAIAFQDPAYATASDNKVSGGHVLSYPTQNEKTDASRIITGLPGARQLDSLQIQLGSMVQPPQAYDFATNLHREAYEAYMLATHKTLSYESAESFIDWLTEPIYLFSIVRPVSEKSTNLNIRATRRNPGPAADVLMHIVEMDQQIVKFEFDQTSGACISTKTMF